MASSQSSVVSTQASNYEFLGPPGALLLCTGVPITTYALYFGCSEESGGCPPKFVPNEIFAALSDPEWWKALWDTQTTLPFIAWITFCVTAWAVLPGDRVTGTILRTGERKVYKINAFSTFVLTLGLAFFVILCYGSAPLTYLHRNFVTLLSASLVVSVFQALACYAISFRPGTLLALGGSTSNPIYNFYIGRELNPSIGSFDLKSFNQLRPGFILWILLDLSMVCEQAVRRGGFSQVTDSLWFILIFQGLYVADILYHEHEIFTKIDITTDGFGFMHSVGYLSWLPFTHSLQARYLVFKPIVLGPVWTTTIVVFNLIGYYIFRVANAEKNDFRNGKIDKKSSYITTELGSKLLTSGWWGRCRHPNYFGDLLMALAWSLPTCSPIPYFYFFYLVALLTHRQRRDDEACEKKYGKEWKKYMELVPYRIVPSVY
ncbi:glycosyltransferase family 2 protein [Favolaschia claudopus]|uniref:Glycosyltransferase family 2 protein n=1 Tax=Favolaschia claudopus TaxID=2862362 RepID=A0AAW0E6G2_9AGAR